MSTRFDRDTAVEPLGPGVYAARIDPGWWVVAAPNGGYLAAIVLRACEAAVGDPTRTPRSLTLHFAAPPEAGPARIETRVERAGRRLSTLSARLLQQERLLVLALAAFSEPRPRGPELSHARMPEVPPPERCPRLEKRIEMHDRYEHRWAVGSQPFAGGDEALGGGWIRLAEPRRLDAPLAAAFTDAFPPALFGAVADLSLVGGVPTVDLTIHFRAPLPPPGARPEDYTLAVFRSRLARDGFVEEDGELWSPRGELLVQSRQHALAR